MKNTLIEEGGGGGGVGWCHVHTPSAKFVRKLNPIVTNVNINDKCKNQYDFRKCAHCAAVPSSFAVLVPNARLLLWSCGL